MTRAGPDPAPVAPASRAPDTAAPDSSAAAADPPDIAARISSNDSRPPDSPGSARRYSTSPACPPLPPPPPSAPPATDRSADPAAGHRAGRDDSVGVRSAPRSARCTAPYTTECTSDAFRNRTSDFVGCAFTSTSAGSISTSSIAVGYRAGSIRPRYASRTAC